MQSAERIRIHLTTAGCEDEDLAAFFLWVLKCAWGAV